MLRPYVGHFGRIETVWPDEEPATLIKEDGTNIMTHISVYFNYFLSASTCVVNIHNEKLMNCRNFTIL